MAELTYADGMETDPIARDRIQHELERAHMEQVTVIPVGQFQNAIAARKSLTGIIPGPALFYWNIGQVKIFGGACCAAAANTASPITEPGRPLHVAGA